MNIQNLSEAKHELDRNEIAKFACLIWEQEGRPAGRDLEFWLQAEAQLAATRMKEMPTPANALNRLPARTAGPSAAEKPEALEGGNNEHHRRHPKRRKAMGLTH